LEVFLQNILKIHYLYHNVFLKIVFIFKLFFT
jgi:hypothetical protein